MLKFDSAEQSINKIAIKLVNRVYISIIPKFEKIDLNVLL